MELVDGQSLLRSYHNIQKCDRKLCRSLALDILERIVHWDVLKESKGGF